MLPQVERSRTRRLAQALKLPTVSGRYSVAWLVLCFAFTAALVPLVLHLPIWIQCEVVLALWWLVWLAALTWLLYVGWHVADDHQWSAPRSWWPSSKSTSSSSSSPSWGSGWSFDLGPVGDLEGCAVVFGIIAALVLLFFGAWFLIEVGIPALAFVLYLAIRGMLVRVVNNGGACRDSLGRSFSTALLWATVYTAPVAAAVWLVHRLVPMPR